MKARVILFIATALGLSTSHGVADEPRVTAGQPSVWMKTKMERSKDILEGLATADFDQIARSAEVLQLLTKMEGFARGSTPGYRTQLQRFEEANQEIIRQAQRDNIEGVTLGFQQLTTSCVQCHQQLRAAKE